MKKTYITLFFILILITCFSCIKETYENAIHTIKGNNTEISIDEAEQMLIKIIESMDATKSEILMHRNISERYSINRQNRNTKTAEEPYIHIFNFENESGFAIMSADKRVTPLLAYALDGNIKQNEEIDNPGLSIYMSLLEDYFNNTIILDTVQHFDTVYNWYYAGNREFSMMINGYCPVKWGQSYPYNYYCHTDNGVRAPTGCVATAIAQLMCTYEYPDNYNGYEFNWDEMIKTNFFINYPFTTGRDMISQTYNIRNRYEPDSGMIQIARLMQQLGLPENLDMQYGTSSSRAYINEIPRTLLNFGYSSGGTIYRFDPTDHEEKRYEKITQELNDGYYCIISGIPYKRDENGNILEDPDKGHCWLLHGLMTFTHDIPPMFKQITDYYYLCNFGWCGKSDGFYLAKVFDTQSGPVYSDPVKNHEDPKNNYHKTDFIINIRK